MNSKLKGRIFDIPQDILNKINHTVNGLNGDHVQGLNRAKRLLADKKVKYGQLKRIIHDLKTIDKVKDRLRYDLYGGELMEIWAMKFLKGERDLLKAGKESKKRADDISSMTGERKNSYNSTHTKRFAFTVPTNLIKSNSNKTSVSPLTSLKLFEEIEKIKKLIIH